MSHVLLDRFRLDDEVVVVTGGSSGPGGAFAEAGADVVLDARRVDRLPATGTLVEAAGRRCTHLQTEPHVTGSTLPVDGGTTMP